MFSSCSRLLCLNTLSWPVTLSLLRYDLHSFVFSRLSSSFSSLEIDFSRSLITVIMLSSTLLVFCLLVDFAPTTFGHGTSCSKTLGPGTASGSVPFWLDSMKHQGISAYSPDPGSYQVYRNVKDFGAKGEFCDLNFNASSLRHVLGDGVTDDTDSIKYVLQSSIHGESFTWSMTVKQYRRALDADRELADLQRELDHTFSSSSRLRSSSIGSPLL